jgi:hypothetical protein
VYEEPLRQLLADLHDADVDRQGTPRGSAQYDEAARRVDRLARAVWEAASGSAEANEAGRDGDSEPKGPVTEL